MMLRPDKLIVHLNPADIAQARILLPVVGSSFLVIFMLARQLARFGPFSIIIQLVSGVSAALFLFTGFRLFFRARSNEPLAILDAQGIWLRDFGLISWGEVRELGIYAYKKSPIKMVAIHLREPQRTIKRAHFRGKCIFFWSKITGVPPVTIGSTDISHAEIIQFAGQFLGAGS
ncbi:MAG: hypothetical protein M1549_01270 [Candidatus Dependentiae bacterium]|nr:hypothetical protein [Candidatus Dependentiae bacterium]